MKVAFHTLGCKVNQYETELLKEQFRKEGYEITDEDSAADVYIVNTCTVTNLADRKSRQYIRKMKNLSKDSLICVIGCYAQVDPEALLKMPEVDIVLGNGEKHKLLDYVKEYEGEKLSHILEYDELSEYNEHDIIFSMEGRNRGFIKIEEGCDRFCSYCLIPFARGHVRSRSPFEVIREAKALIENGFKEIVLTGINTALYGTEEGFNEKYGVELSGLEYIIREINSIPGEFRIRLSSLEPTVVNREYVERLIKYEKLCHHLHLSIQSGSDHIISHMNRHYTREEYMEIVDALRRFDPYYGITTDIIVGFSGETEEDFMDSMDIVERAKFLKVHTFKYSKRKGTRGYSFKDEVDSKGKDERSEQLKEKSAEVTKEFLLSQVGTVRKVLFEEGEKVKSGYTDSYIKVYVETEKDVLNSLMDVRLTGIYKDGMKGELANG
ncbi:MAG: tRNA (N(6)-L-threonylcarbamoyladenosine(37)-C(2))-methylthiotransferase MtaB [Clostridia bacterium]|nr:tRNA (N(6)-L-threonylcarbamoyladenosine(37)-C(2))-methylthiotransferase MtaB [Clostridia bacterium]